MSARDGVATYLYCVVRTPTAPGVKRTPRGLAGTGPVRCLHVGDSLWLIVADAPLSLYGAGPIERGLRDLDWVSARALLHDAVIEHFARVGTVVPMKLFTLFGTDERALASIRRSQRRLERLLDRVSGRQEWGVRVTLDEARAVASARAQVRTTKGRPVSGTSFLRVKKAERDVTGKLVREAGREVHRGFGQLARLADGTRRRSSAMADGTTHLLLDAAFLVPTRKRTGFTLAVRGLARQLEALGCNVTMTGPWPPYNFVGKSA